MEDFNQLRELWLTEQAAGLPDPAALTRAVVRVRTRSFFTIAAIILFALLLLSILVWVLFSYHSRLLATRLGEAGMMTALLIFLAAKAGGLYRTSQASTLSNGEFIRWLEKKQATGDCHLRRMQATGFSLASVGLLLYVYEPARDSTTKMIVTYVLALAWISLIWFLARPKAMRRAERKSAERLERLKALAKQLEEPAEAV